MSQISTGNQVLGDCGQRMEPNTQSLQQKERADVLSDSTPHRMWEWYNSEQRLTEHIFKTELEILLQWVSMGRFFVVQNDAQLLYLL